MLAIMTALLISGAELAPATATIEEWQVPWEKSRPRDPYVGGPDTIWFVGQQADYAAILTPSTGAMKRIDLPAGAGPHNIIVDDRGAWYAGNKAAHIGFIDPQTEQITQYPLPGDGRRDVHTMDFDPATGDIWFTVQGGNQIGKFAAADQQFTLWDVPTERARPYGLQFVNGQPWVVLFGSNKLATVVGDDHGYIWLVETGVQPNQLVGFHKASATFTAPIAVPSGGGSVRHMVYEPSDNSLWFGTDSNTIGKATITYP